jgi:hypothetical protein
MDHLLQILTGSTRSLQLHRESGLLSSRLRTSEIRLDNGARVTKVFNTEVDWRPSWKAEAGTRSEQSEL